MCSKRYRKREDIFSDTDNSWEEELERLKLDIKRAEKKIIMSQQTRLTEKAKPTRELDKTDKDSVRSSNLMDLCSSQVAERISRGRKHSSASLESRNNPVESVREDVVNVPAKRMSKESISANWVSPSASKTHPIRSDVIPDPFSSRLESSFDLDCGSSVISLDFGLVSPNKNWCSPPQRIERAQNREWSSPHRVIDRPNPENSPGNWISMKESCLTLRHSPTLDVRNQPIETPNFTCPEPGPRPVSQSTYVIPETVRSQESHAKDNQPTRKTSVLEDYEPERIVSTKKRTGGPSDAIDSNLLPTNGKVRRVVDPSGHVIKISRLDDFEAPAFGKSHDKTSEVAENEVKESSDKTINRTTNKIKKISTKLSPSAFKPQAKKKKEESKDEGGTSTRTEAVHDSECGPNKNLMEEINTKKEEENEEKEDINKSTQSMLKDLENILRAPIKERDKTIVSSIPEKSKDEKLKQKNFKYNSKRSEIEEKTSKTPEKKNRNVDPKVVQEYIKNQKQKRMEQVKTEKKTKKAEREARKKKLEELRIKTLKLAAQSKKKKPPQSTIKVVEQGTEDDVTMSLGLKQTKPKVSYNESVSKLKKKVTQQKPQLSQLESQLTELDLEESEDDKEMDDHNIGDNLDEVQPENKNEKEDINLKKPEETIELKPASDLNATLKKLADTLHLKLEKEKQLHTKSVSLASKSAKDILSQVPSQETLRSVKSAPEENRQLLTVDLETIQTLKNDIKKISENFKVLHEIILDKADLSEKRPFKKQSEACKSKPSDLNCPLRNEEPKEIPEWLKRVVSPRTYPYNIFTAFQQKMNLKSNKTLSSLSKGSSTFAEPISNKYDSDFEMLSMPSDRLRSVKETTGSFKSTSCSTSEENYYSMKGDSGSELSSSILDSENRSLTSVDMKKPYSSHSVSKGTRSKDSLSSSIITEITSRSLQVAESNDSINPKSYYSKLGSDRENLILVTPDLKLISNDLHQDKPNNYRKNLNVLQTYNTRKDVEPEGLNNSEKSYKELKTDSTITELIDNLSENDKSIKSLKSTNEKSQNIVQKREEVPVRRSFFQPEMLHLQFQAELILLETFQQSLSHFLEAERMKTLSEVNKIVYEKAINTEKSLQKEDQAVQTSQLNESPDKATSEEADSVKTEINIEEESVKAKNIESPKREDDLISEMSEKVSCSSKETLKDGRETHPKDLETSDFSNGHAGISFQMLNRIMKDEELRSEHQLALIRLREKTLNEKIKAEITFLEMKKRALKERGGDEEQNISAIKKKQRGILLKYQSEKEEIERLKKMHKIASEERKIMIKQQKQIQQMQISTKDMIIKLKKREKSPQKKTPLKPKALKSSDSQSEIPEDIAMLSDSVLSESCSAEESRQSSRTDISSRSNISENDSDIFRRNPKSLLSKSSYSLENFKPKKSFLEVEKHPRKRHSVEDLLSWTRRLEEKENHLKELEKQTVSAAIRAKSRLMKSLKSIKTSVKDRSTSPFQFPDSIKTVSEVSPTEALETKKSTTVSEAIESNQKAEVSDKTESVVEKIQSSASEDVLEPFSKKMLTSRTEYYSESFESPSSSEAPKTKPEVPGTKSASTEWNQKGITIKLPLSPRMQSPRRRYSSGSDDSLNLSHTETASEQSDLESRIAALHEQLRKRKLEAERLRREQKKAQRERLRIKEQSLLKQIQAYDAYIQKKKQELEQEYEHSNQSVMKPVIKQPKVAEKSGIKRHETFMLSDSEKLGLYARLGAKSREKDETACLSKIPDKESDGEITEQIKDTSESIKEVLDSDSDSIKEGVENRLEEEENSKITETVLNVKNFTKESGDVPKSTSVSESLLEQDDVEGSQSESEDQSISIKTTLLSPEKQDTEIMETQTGTAEEESQNKQTIDEDVYQFDSFESDAEEKMTTRSENIQKSSETNETGMEIKTDTTISEPVLDEEKFEKESVESDLVSQVKEELEDGRKSEQAEKITDSIIMELILESLNIFCSKKAEAEKKLAQESKLSLEALSSFLAREIISEAVDDIIKIYNKRVTPEKKTVSQERITTEVRKRITEIMSQKTGRSRDQPPPQDMMVTTYDVSPVETPPEERLTENAEREKFLQSLAFSKKDKKLEGQTFADGKEESNHELKGEAFGHEWIDDDFGLRRTRREAEELRLQQLQIEQEIQQLQAQQEQVPYFYLREIPNKPPPPYTPPGKPLVEIPVAESDITAITMNAVRILTDEMNKGKQIVDVEPPWNYFGDAESEHFKCYKFFLFDLAKHIILNLIEQQEKKTEALPWMRTREHLSKYKYQKIERTFECLSEFVRKQVLILFGFSKKVSKETLIVKWIKKKRDNVDEILVGESQEEESQWTQYDEDQVTVKNEVALAILDGLLEDTTRAVNSAFRNKLKKEKTK